jgi:protein TonB
MRPVPLATPFGRLAHERGRTRGVILSAAVHLAVVAFLVWSGTRLMVTDRAPGPGRGRGGGGGGGGNRTLVLLVPPAPAAPAPAPPAPAIVMPTQLAVVIPEVQPDTTPRAPAAPAQPAAAGQGPGEGPGKGAGVGPGSGTGSGGGSGSGVGPGSGPDSGGGGRVYPPQPQGIILPPPDRPSSLRGTTVTAVFEISATGEVTHVALDPAPRDHKFANEFLERLRRFTFTPAYTVDGHPVAALFRINITL